MSLFKRPSKEELPSLADRAEQFRRDYPTDQGRDYVANPGTSTWNYGAASGDRPAEPVQPAKESRWSRLKGGVHAVGDLAVGHFVEGKGTPLIWGDDPKPQAPTMIDVPTPTADELEQHYNQPPVPHPHEQDQL